MVVKRDFFADETEGAVNGTNLLTLNIHFPTNRTREKRTRGQLGKSP